MKDLLAYSDYENFLCKRKIVVRYMAYCIYQAQISDINFNFNS